MAILRLVFPAIALLIVASPVLAGSQCPPDPYSRDDLLELKSNGFELDNEAQRNELALLLLACLSYPDPLIRDGVVFEGTSAWLRGQQLNEDTTVAMHDELLVQLASDTDPLGFQQPFAALVLSEVARTDRVQPVFSQDTRLRLVDAAVSYLEGVEDYRGYSESEGWRHGVAHGSDLVLQLALNEAIGGAQLQALADAVASQVSPPGAVFYIYGEPGRLARAAYYLQRRDFLSQEYWAGWYERIASSAPLEAWSETWSSQAGMAKRHNTQAFLSAMYLYSSAAGDEQGEVFAAMAMRAMEQTMR